jgi:uncharacterized protein YggE
MNRIFTLAFFLLTFISTAQNENASRTLEVVGSAKVAVSPDIGVLNINVSHIDSIFSNSINGLNSKTKNISDQLKNIGFDQSAIRTNNFDVQKNTVYRNNKTIDSGYIARQLIHLEFINNKDNISKILNQFTGSNTQFNLNFRFKLSDTLKESVQKQIIALATKDAFSKAKLISDASSTKVENIRKINYGNNFNGGMTLYNNDKGLNEIVLRGNSSMSEGFAPSDIVYTDDILVIWNLK